MSTSTSHQVAYGLLVAARGKHVADDIWNEWTPAERSAVAEFTDVHFGSVIRKCCADLVAWKDALDAKYVCTCGPNEYCAADDCHGATASRPRRSYQVEPFHESDGRKTWAVKEIVVGPHGYVLRYLIGFHETFTDADRQRERMKLREREGSWGDPYEEAMLEPRIGAPREQTGGRTCR